jgi:hypothetical protein
MAEKVPKSTRLPKDEAELVEAYADEHELTEADALRRLIRSGLEEQPELVRRKASSAPLDIINLLVTLVATALIALLVI